MQLATNTAHSSGILDGVSNCGGLVGILVASSEVFWQLGEEYLGTNYRLRGYEVNFGCENAKD